MDKVRKEQRIQTVEADLSGFRTLFVGGEKEKSVLESAAKRGDVVQYILVLLGDLIDGAYHVVCKPALRLSMQIIPCLRSKYRHSISS